MIETMRVTMSPLGKKSFVSDMRRVFDAAQGLEMETIRKQWAAGEQIKSSEAVIRTYKRAWQAMEDAGYVTVERS